MKKLCTLLLLPVAMWAQLSGTYTIGTGGNFDSLGAAIAALNTNGVSGPVVMEFLNGTHNVGANVSLGCTGTSSTNTITFKPAAGATVTINFLDASSTSASIDGHFVIGSPNALNTNLVSTNYVTIDGSNNGTTSKDLTINGPVTTFQRSVIRIYGNNDNITIKNCIIVNQSSSASSTAPINVTNYNSGGINYTPDNLTVQNNTLTSVSGNGGLGIMLSNSGTPTVGMTGITIQGNTITHRGTRGVMCNYVNDANIYGNTISANMQLAAGAGAGIWLSTGTSAAGTFNIYNNKFSNLQFLNNTAGASNGYIAIDNQFASPKVVNIYNNFITGFTPSASVSNSKIYGIRHTGSSTSNIYFNTIYLPEMTNMTTFGSSLIAGIAFATAATTEASPTGTINIKNNIIISDETTMKTWGVRRVGANGTFTMDYNNIYMASADSGFVGYYSTTDQKTLANWQTASSQDANSKSKAVTFVSSTDLHLTGSSNGDVDLIGVTGLGVSTDIDGETRSGTFPYMGADEGSIPLPVELTSFTAVTRGKNVELRWTTATELNNYGFEIEKKRKDEAGSKWEKIGFVEGSGTTNAPKEYSFSDALTANGTYVYRLKQLDRDGQFTYSPEVEVVASNVAQIYSLKQNYPNPFNPATTISFTVPSAERATLKVYDLTGREVATLFNEVANPGQTYNVLFNGKGLASGIYIYVLQTPTFREVKKMQLLK